MKKPIPDKAKWPKFKTCRFLAEAIVSEGIDKGEVRRVCDEADCPIHHPKKQSTNADFPRRWPCSKFRKSPERA